MLLLIFIWAIAVNWLAIRKGYYQLPKGIKKTELPVSLYVLLGSFGIYLLSAFVLGPFAASFLFSFLRKIHPDLTTIPISLLTGIQFSLMVLIFFFLQLLSYRHDTTLYKMIWKNPARPSLKPIEFDFGIGLLTWLLSFPIVSLLGEFVDKILKTFGLNHYEQTAVKFVKAAMGSPLSLVFALLSVLILAPLIEEFLFRGLLQSYCKKWVGSKAAILLSALFFSLFHFSPSQGMGNVSLLLSLFLLGGYLGFLYERQGSLWAPIGLHMTFNAVSALRILIFPETAI